ncbi:MAG: SulP family inorganic anion transporter [Solirubrobacterales bacterium]|nr:SulP family inorganic anion transporter [Solirubrobacterales bacterium]
MPVTELVGRVKALLPRRADLADVRRSPRRDLIAGITVAIVALPLALAFGVASGLGAQAGLATAVVAGTVAAVFGGSNLQVSGPTGAMTVVLLPVVSRFGTQGVLMVGAMAGLIIVVLAIARMGRYVDFLPMPVVEGFTAGIAVIIALQQVPAALGISDAKGTRVWQVAADAVGRFVGHPSAGSVGIALGVAAVMLIGARLRPELPFSLLGVAVATAAAQLFPLGVKLLGTIPSGLPAPSLGFVNPATFEAMLPSALAIAALASLESLLSATVADGMSVNQKTDPDRELFGQGLANIAAPIFGGVPATGAIARTAVNVRAGATSRLSAAVHALVLAVIVYTAGPLVGLIPLAALAGVLFATAFQMVESASLLALARSTRRDALVLALTFTVTVAIDLVTAVAVGVGVAVVLALRAVTASAGMEEVPIAVGDHSSEEHTLLAENIVAYRLDGPLVFAAAHRFLLELTDVAQVRVVILRMSRVTTIDATGARVLSDAIRHLERRGIVVALSGLTSGHGDVLAAMGASMQTDYEVRNFDTTPQAIEYAREIIRKPRPA